MISLFPDLGKGITSQHLLGSPKSQFFHLRFVDYQSSSLTRLPSSRMVVVL